MSTDNQNAQGGGENPSMTEGLKAAQTKPDEFQTHASQASAEQAQTPPPSQPGHTPNQQTPPCGNQYYYPPNYQAPAVTNKDHVAAGLLAIFLGGLGIHKFYLGYNTAGFIMLAVTVLGSIFSLGLAFLVVWIIAVIEGIVYFTKSQDEFECIYLFNKREWF